MNPPISNPIQGAYVVAAVITGIVFGALALIFAEVTEGLGCLLGGFCLSMWLLVLKPGGLLTSTSSKAILIAAFTLTAYSLSFHHLTRTYGLMGSTAFSGATAIVLGMDCFSRAGLKEFWLYIWGMFCFCSTMSRPSANTNSALNGNLFPLGTTTYPHTRGIRVEIAAIALIFIIGIISQMKLWKVVKQRREEKAAERAQHERDLDRIEEDVGRRVEEQTTRERSQWEGVYGDGDRSQMHKADSGNGDDGESTRKGSTSMVETRELSKRGESIEMSEIGTSRRTSHTGTVVQGAAMDEDGNAVTVRVVADEDGYRELGEDGEVLENENDEAATAKSRPHSGAQVSFEPTSGSLKKSKSMSKTPRSSVPPPPAVVPLPFSVPESTEAANEDGTSSIATFAESDRNVARRSKRMSGGSALNRLSVASSRLSRAMSESQEALVVPHYEDDRASSLAATIDDLTSDEESDAGSEFTTTPVPKPEDDVDTSHITDPCSTIEPSTDGHSTQLLSSTNATSVDLAEAAAQGKTTTTDTQTGTPNSTSNVVSKRGSLTSNGESKEQDRGREQSIQKTRSSDKLKQKRSRSLKSAAKSESSGRESLAGLNEQLPKQVSKVVMSYRTNEWAKHLAAAEKPDLDELKLAEYPVEAGNKKQEFAAPVDVEELQQTAETAQSAPLSRSMSQVSLQSEHPVATGRSSPDNSRAPSRAQTKAVPARSPSARTFNQQTSPQRSASQLSNNPYAQNMMHSANNLTVQTQTVNARGFRSSSSPLLQQTLVESPIEEVDETRMPQSTPSPLPSNTLMAKRDTMVRNKYASVAMNQFGSMPELIPNDSASVHNVNLATLDDEEMSLSERKALMAQQQMQQQQQQPQQQQYIGPLTAHNQPFDSHQPKREHAVDPQRRETMLAHWRQSIQQEIGAKQQEQPVSEFRRAEMLNERHQSRLSQQQVAMANKVRDSVFDERMRRGDMIDLHKEAMRRMQANANKHV